MNITKTFIKETNFTAFKGVNSAQIASHDFSVIAEKNIEIFKEISLIPNVKKSLTFIVGTKDSILSADNKSIKIRTPLVQTGIMTFQECDINISITSPASCKVVAAIVPSLIHLGLLFENSNGFTVDYTCNGKSNTEKYTYMLFNSVIIEENNKDKSYAGIGLYSDIEEAKNGLNNILHGKGKIKVWDILELPKKGFNVCKDLALRILNKEYNYSIPYQFTVEEAKTNTGNLMNSNRFVKNLAEELWLVMPDGVKETFQEELNLGGQFVNHLKDSLWFEGFNSWHWG